jgi:iron-sulfur cluster repair protein YtfE (RIC family)
MSIRSSKPFLLEHAELRDQIEHLPVIARNLPGMEAADRAETVELVVGFLADMLLPHCAAEERILYPEAARLLGEDDASDAVAADREHVRGLLSRLAAADDRDVGTLQEIVVALYVLLASHMWREEEMYLKLAAIRDDPRAGVILDNMSRTDQPQGSEGVAAQQ